MVHRHGKGPDPPDVAWLGFAHLHPDGDLGMELRVIEYWPKSAEEYFEKRNTIMPVPPSLFETRKIGSRKKCRILVG